MLISILYFINLFTSIKLICSFIINKNIKKEMDTNIILWGLKQLVISNKVMFHCPQVHSNKYFPGKILHNLFIPGKFYYNYLPARPWPCFVMLTICVKKTSRDSTCGVLIKSPLKSPKLSNLPLNVDTFAFKQFLLEKS